MSQVDTEFITVNQLAYRFCKSAETGFDKNVGLQLIELMNKYQSLHPCVDSLIVYLSQHNAVPNYINNQWLERIKHNTEVEFSQFDASLNSFFEDSSEGLDSEQSSSTFLKMKQLIVKLIINTRYQKALDILQKYTAVVEFQSQPKVEVQLESNKYIEYSYLKYVVNLMSKIWFPMDDNKFENNSANDKLPTLSSTSFKPLEKIYLTSIAYYKRNESLFKPELDEYKYLIHLKILHLSLLFKQFRFNEFYELFNEIRIECVNSELRSNVYIMYGIVLIFLKPFNQLSLMDDESLIDVYNDIPDSIESNLYHKILIPLSNCEFADAKRNFNEINFGSLDYSFPVSCNKVNFIDYVKLIIDFKNFFVLIQNCHQISRHKMVDLIGADATILNKLIGLIYALELHKYGINYKPDEQVFINKYKESEFISKSISALQVDIDDLAAKTQAETLSTKMQSIYFSLYAS